MSQSTSRPVPATTRARARTLPDLWGPAVRIVTHPTMGPFSIHANLAFDGFEAFPMDTHRAWREGTAQFWAESVESMAESIHNWR